MQNKIAIFAPTIKRSIFFHNLYEQLLKEKFEVVFITLKKSAYNYLKSKKVDVISIKNIKGIKFNNDEKIFFEDSLNEALKVDRKIGLLNENNLNKNYWYLVSKLISFFKKNQINFFLIFNGYAQYIEYSAMLVAKYLKINTLFFEIGNFPNKIFVDTKGVNAASSLMDIDLRKIPCDIKNFEKFKKEYLIKKEKQHFVPQSIKKENFLQKIIDHDRFDPSILARVKNLVKNYIFRSKQIKFDKIPNKNYLFFPLQVSYDSQVLRFSKVNLFEAIDIASSEAKRKNLAFVIKPHPAESNYKVLEYAKSKDAFIVNENTYLLLKNASLIYTINSTVGLESFFYNKPLVVLGEAFYKKYANDTYENKIKVLCNYLNNILVDGSYFDESVKFNRKILDLLK